jgi:hypothetical protein
MEQRQPGAEAEIIERRMNIAPNALQRLAGWRTGRRKAYRPKLVPPEAAISQVNHCPAERNRHHRGRKTPEGIDPLQQGSIRVRNVLALRSLLSINNHPIKRESALAPCASY